jgi:hypothetical protein
VSWICTSYGRTSSSLTTPDAPCVPVVEVRSRVRDAGGCAGSRVTVASAVEPFKLPDTVTCVAVVTSCVGIETVVEAKPSGTVAVAGGFASGELLDRLTTDPPGGALP